MIFIAVFILSLSSLFFEITLTRVFAITQWHHLSFMVISIALLGFAASGTIVSLYSDKKKHVFKITDLDDRLYGLVLTYAVWSVVSSYLLCHIPLDYFRLPIEPVQIIYLLFMYIILSMPFFLTGLVISMAFAFFPEKTGWVYFSNMAGSGIGAIFPGLLLPVAGEERTILISAIIPLLLCFFKTKNHSLKIKESTSSHMRLCVFLVLLLTTGGIIFSSSDMLDVKPSAYKALSQILQYPDTYVAESKSSLRGRVDIVNSPYIRFAPGLSLKYLDTLLCQGAVYKDGDNEFILYDSLVIKRNDFSKFILSYIGYLLTPDPDKLLIVVENGGLSIVPALSSGVAEKIIIVQQKDVAKIIGRHYGCDVKGEPVRLYLSKTTTHFDIIQIENWGASLTGAAALTQEYYFTLESFVQYLNHLSANGVLVISQKLLLPPSNMLRLFAAAYESLRYTGIKNPGDHIAIIRNWNTFTMAVTKQPINCLSEIKAFALENNFDLVYIPGMGRDLANRFNVFDAPYHYLEIDRLKKAYESGKERYLFHAYPLDIFPSEDNRPFPHKLLKLSGLKEVHNATGKRLYTLLLSGEIVVIVVLFEVLGISGIMLLLPFGGKRKTKTKISFLSAIFFLTIGAGYIFVELFFIFDYTLLFGDPLISLVVVLSGILVFSGFGGMASQQIDKKYHTMILAALVGMLLVYYFFNQMIIGKLLCRGTIQRYLFSLFLLFLPGFSMGFPFTWGMQNLLKHPGQRAYAWAVNGAASVIGSVMAMQMALDSGIRLILACGIAMYLISCVISLKSRG